MSHSEAEQTRGYLWRVAKDCACGDCDELLSQEQRDERDVALLKSIIARRMERYPHGSPHPETVDMMAAGLLAVIDVSNARSEKYADEPWREQGRQEHVNYCTSHAYNARQSLVYPRPENPWLSDLGQPEIAHAILRGMMCLWQHGRGK